MGVITLEEFRQDLTTAMGDLGWDDPKLDRMINHAYYDITGGIRFEDLTEIETTDTVSGTATIARPNGARKVLVVRDVTSDNYLGWIPKAEYYRRLAATTGAPTNWTEVENLIYLWPKPNAVFSILKVYLKDPARLVAADDVTVIPAVWDPAIWMNAARFAFMANGQEQRAAFWYSQMVAYLQTKFTEEELHSLTAGLGRSLPQTQVQMMQQAQALGMGG